MFINSALLLERIKKLSETEPNNLTRRCAKFSEELGELSAACLAVDDPDGKNYKDLGPKDVKEESVDCLLMAFSTFFDPTVGGTVKELVELLSNKCDKWEKTSHKGVKLSNQTLTHINEMMVNSSYIDKQAESWHVFRCVGLINHASLKKSLNDLGYVQMPDEGGGFCNAVLFVNIINKQYKFWYNYDYNFSNQYKAQTTTIQDVNDLLYYIEQYDKPTPQTHNGWYAVDFGGITERKAVVDYLSSCCFTKENCGRDDFAFPILLINPTVRTYKFIHDRSSQLSNKPIPEVRTISGITDLSNFINVAINKVN